MIALVPETSQTRTALNQLSLTHLPFVTLHQKHRPEEFAPKTNTALSAPQNALLELSTNKDVNAAAYPYLPRA